MSSDDVIEVVEASVKGGILSALIATASGLTLVKVPVFFGLFTAGPVLCPWLVSAWALGGVGAGTGTAALKHRRRKKQIAHLMRLSSTEKP